MSFPQDPVQGQEYTDPLTNISWLWDDPRWVPAGGGSGGSGGGGTGIPGPQGPQGDPGPAGPAGPQGPAGPTGPQGSQGIAGPAGPQGIQGTGLHPIGTVSSASVLVPGQRPDGSAASDGDFVIAADTGHGWVFVGGNGWIDIGAMASQVPGPQGPAGVQGPQGATGVPGAQGPAGPQGQQGPSGIPTDAPNDGQMYVRQVQGSVGNWVLLPP